MNKNIQIINLLNGDEKTTKIKIDKTTIEIGAYFLKNIIKEFLKNNGNIEKIKKNIQVLTGLVKAFVICVFVMIQKGVQ